MDLNKFEGLLDEVLGKIGTTLKEKNRSYGGSAVKPLGIFTKLGVKERLLVRIEDKLKRIEALGIDGFGEDNLNDLIGYLLILKIQDLHEKREATTRQIETEAKERALKERTLKERDPTLYKAKQQSGVFKA